MKDKDILRKSLTVNVLGAINEMEELLVTLEENKQGLNLEHIAALQLNAVQILDSLNILKNGI